MHFDIVHKDAIPECLNHLHASSGSVLACDTVKTQPWNRKSKLNPNLLLQIEGGIGYSLHDWRLTLGVSVVEF